MINFYNFMDGIDGIDGAQAVITGGVWVWAGVYLNQPMLYLLGLLITASSYAILALASTGFALLWFFDSVSFEALLVGIGLFGVGVWAIVWFKERSQALAKPGLTASR